MPAYDHLLKLSHVFNVMDARGAVGVTERQACFATLRGLARQVTGEATHPQIHILLCSWVHDHARHVSSWLQLITGLLATTARWSMLADVVLM